jgi:hypothetical protein
VLGRRIIGKVEPVEAVASYEWGRYEVIGGNSLTREWRLHIPLWMCNQGNQRRQVFADRRIQ